MSRQFGILLSLEVEGDKADAEGLDELTRRLQAEISELPVASVALAPAGSIPARMKAGSGIRAGVLTIALTPGVIPPLIDQLRSWAARQSSAPVKLKLQVSDQFELDLASTSPEQISALVMELERSQSEK